MTSRERVYRSLTFDHPDRVPRDLWALPIAWLEHGQATRARFLDRFPLDFARAPTPGQPPSSVSRGDQYEVGTYVDEWGCIFQNIKRGVIGEVKEPIVTSMEDVESLHLPAEQLVLDVDQLNGYCRSEERFVLGGGYARPFERLQFLRGPENVYADLAADEEITRALLAKVADFSIRRFEVWAKTDVDALVIVDDWGGQHSLLINPVMWRRVFKPIYAELAAVAKQGGKKVFMHSDGFIFPIYEDLIEVGVDAVNSQLFCMDIEEIGRRYASQISFWGEIDRQAILPRAGVAEVSAAVERVRAALCVDGAGVIAQFSWEEHVPVENAQAVFEAWARLDS